MEHPEEMDLQALMLKHLQQQIIMEEVALQNAKLLSPEARDQLAHLVPLDSLDLLDLLHQQALDHLVPLDHQDPMDNPEDLETKDHPAHLDNLQKVKNINKN